MPQWFNKVKSPGNEAWNYVVQVYDRWKAPKAYRYFFRSPIWLGIRFVGLRSALIVSTIMFTLGSYQCLKPVWQGCTDCHELHGRSSVWQLMWQVSPPAEGPPLKPIPDQLPPSLNTLVEALPAGTLLSGDPHQLRKALQPEHPEPVPRVRSHATTIPHTDSAAQLACDCWHVGHPYDLLRLAHKTSYHAGEQWVAVWELIVATLWTGSTSATGPKFLTLLYNASLQGWWLILYVIPFAIIGWNREYEREYFRFPEDGVLPRWILRCKHKFERPFAHGLLCLVERLLPVLAIAAFIGGIHHWNQLSACGLAILIVFFFVSLYISAALYLNERFAEIDNVRQEDGNIWDEDGRSQTKIVGLPFQRMVVDKIVGKVKTAPNRNQAKVITLKGDRGTGKSHIIRILQRHYQPWRRPAGGSPPDELGVVFIHVEAWRYSSEADLHLGLYESLLSHPYVPCNRHRYSLIPRILSYPTILVPIYLLRYFTSVFRRGSLTTPWVNFSVSLPTMLWQQQMESQVDRLLDRGFRIVWCLDEIDRSTPELAQSIVVFSRRFLSQPGTFVIMAYVQEQLHYKVFNPLIRTLPDIGSTMQAILLDHAEQHAAASTVGNPSPPTSFAKILRPTTSGGAPLTFEDMLSSKLICCEPGGSQSVEAGSLLEAEPHGTSERLLQWRLMEYYNRSSGTDRQDLRAEFEEKFIDQAPVDVPPLADEDRLFALWLVDDLYQIIARIFAHWGFRPDRDGYLEVLGYCEDSDRLLSPNPGPLVGVERSWVKLHSLFRHHYSQPVPRSPGGPSTKKTIRKFASGVQQVYSSGSAGSGWKAMLNAIPVMPANAMTPSMTNEECRRILHILDTEVIRPGASGITVSSSIKFLRNQGFIVNPAQKGAGLSPDDVLSVLAHYVVRNLL
jgi:hypothetical protein